MSKDILRIVQLSDVHLMEKEEESLLGVNTGESFTAVVDLVKADKNRPEFMLLSGDLGQDTSDAVYLRLAEMVKDLGMPVYYVPGNHDDVEVMAKVYPRHNLTHHRHIVLKHWHLILLNSQKPGAVEGHLDHTQLSFLQHCLQMYPEHYAIVVMHHPSFLVGSAWIDRYVLTNADDLWTILSNFPKVRAVLCGHVHQECEGDKKGIHYYSVPSTCFQFKKNSVEFAIENIPPGYRWIDLSPDGKIKTGITRCAHYVGKFEPDARGY